MYYIALLAPDEINSEILKWKYFFRDNFGCVAALKSPAHITLTPPFWMKTELENDLINFTTDFSIYRKAFSIRLSNFSVFKPKVIFVDVLKNEKLELLHSDFNNALLQEEKYPLKKDETIFHPHLTLATRDLSKKNFEIAWKIFASKQYEAEWTVAGISLLRHNKKKMGCDIHIPLL